MASLVRVRAMGQTGEFSQALASRCPRFNINDSPGKPSAETYFVMTAPELESPDSLEALSRLMQTLRDRADQMPEGSYTTKLMAGGAQKIGGKIREEAEELIEAAEEMPSDKSDDADGKARSHFIYEAGDLIYHTMVMLAWRGVDLSEVAAELARREGTSGLTEKANRKK